jgi:hypothetical protein
MGFYGGVTAIFKYNIMAVIEDDYRVRDTIQNLLDMVDCKGKRDS